MFFNDVPVRDHWQGRCRSGWEWAAVEGPARIGGNDPQLLRDVFTAAGGTHDDWDEYDRVMASENRVAVFVTPERVYSN